MKHSRFVLHLQRLYQDIFLRSDIYYCDEIYNNDTTFINDVIENEVYRELYQFLDELPPQCRVIFERVLQGETSETIAKSMHLSIETVKTQRKKAKHILRERYKLLFNIIGIFL